LLAATDTELVVASNRQPYRHDYGEGDEIEVDKPAGGLTAGIDEVMRRLGGTWIAWGDGDADDAVVDAEDTVAVPPDDEAYDLRRLWLDEDDVEDYYYGISNQLLWPICHAALGTVEACGDAWSQYREVNDEFAAAVASAADDSLVWLQDYHLALAPRLVRERSGADPFIAHSWHIPWPSWDTFRACPHREEIVRGLLGSDLLGFHVPRYCANFLESAEAALDDAVVDYATGEVSFRGETTLVRAFPMGVPAERIHEQADGMEAAGFREAFKRTHGIDADTTIGIGVDRLDYTKGIPERLAALGELFERQPRWQGDLTYVQVGTETRSWIPAYARYQEDVESAVDDLNDRFGTEEWQPVVYTTDMLSNEALAGLYREADLALVSPIRDGMNLVAQEYVAAQVGEDTGVLLLSDQAGAHDELGEWTVPVRPHDTTGFADAIEAALTMPVDERHRRCSALREHVFEHDIERWVGDVLATVQTHREGTSPPRMDAGR
jgi:trehalose 6-phosphate synthase